MKKDCHYYMIGTLALEAGFSKTESQIIASSSQYTDDCCDFDKERFALKGTGLRPIVTQNVSLDSVIGISSELLQQFVYLPFHYLPGQNNNYIVEANSQNAKDLVLAAIRSQNLFEFGIALHTYADTFSHQGFSAFEDDVNSVVTWKTFYRDAIKNIGHADVLNSPDTVEEVWFDYRKPKGQQRIVNKERFNNALLNCFNMLVVYKNNTEAITESKSKKVKDLIDSWLNLEDYDDRIEELRKRYMHQLIPYNYSYSFNCIEDFHYNFQKAARVHLERVFWILNANYPHFV